MCFVVRAGVGRVLMHKKLQEFGGGVLFLRERGQKRKQGREVEAPKGFENRDV